MKRFTPFLFPIVLIVAMYFILVKDYEKSENKIFITDFQGETIKFAKWDKFTNSRSGFYKGKCHLFPMEHPFKLMFASKYEIEKLSEVNMKDVSPEDIKTCLYKGRMFDQDSTSKPYKL